MHEQYRQYLRFLHTNGIVCCVSKPVKCPKLVGMPISQPLVLKFKVFLEDVTSKISHGMVHHHYTN